MKDGIVEQLHGPCLPIHINELWNDPESENQIKMTGLLALITHSTSAICLLIILALYSFIKKLRINPMGKYWIVFSVLSIANYCYVIWLIGLTVDFDIKNKLDSRKLSENLSFTTLLFFEFAFYIWLLIICMEIFMNLR